MSILRIVLSVSPFVFLAATACQHGLVPTPAASSIAPEVPASTFNPTGFKHWASQFATTAKTKGITQKTLDSFLSNAQYIPRVIALDRAQPDSTKTFSQYQALVLPKSRIQTARQQLQTHQAILSKVSIKYGVQPEFIVALWAVESDFGRHMGNFDTVSALATLAYEGRRADFFKQELIAALTMIDQEHIDFKKMKGSWAGAMGQTQFMPSSFLELAVDYNGDNKRDIWSTPEDVFASIAHYLSKRGWHADQNWGYKATLPKTLHASLLGTNTTKSMQEWNKLGVRPVASDIPLRSSTMLSLIQPDKTKPIAYLVTSNYKTLLQWNRSMYFATTVGMLADHIHSHP